MQAERAVAVDSSEVAEQPARARGKRSRRNFWQVFGAPIILGLVSTVGLIAALVGDGFYDAVSWLTLSIPVAVILKYLR